MWTVLFLALTAILDIIMLIALATTNAEYDIMDAVFLVLIVVSIGVYFISLMGANTDDE